MASREDVHRGEIVGDALVALFLGFTAERLSLVGSPVKISLPPLQSGGGQKRTGQEIMAGLGIFAPAVDTCINKDIISNITSASGYIDLHAMMMARF